MSEPKAREDGEIPADATPHDSQSARIGARDLNRLVRH